LNRFENVLGKLSTGRSILIFFTLYLVFVLGLLPILAEHSSGAQVIDLAFHYSIEEVYAWMELYGAQGRHRYMLGEMTIDVLYPIIYTCLFCGVLGFLLNFKQGGQYRWLATAPFSIWFFDLLENTGIVAMLYNYPEKLEQVALLTSWATSIKWSLAATILTLTIILGVRFLAQKFSSN